MFEVRRDGAQVEVVVDNGAVLVRGPWVPDGVQRLEAGQTLRSRPPEPETTRSPAPSVEPSRHPWRQAARAGRFDEAWEALGERGHTRAVQRTEEVDGLLELADIARYSGHPDAACAPLERVLDEHPSDARAPLAAYTPARVASSAGAHAQALRALERASTLNLPAALEEPAAALEVELLHRTGQPGRAAQAADAFLLRYPQSARADGVRRWATSP